jgi:hypothetical protein
MSWRSILIHAKGSVVCPISNDFFKTVAKVSEKIILNLNAASGTDSQLCSRWRCLASQTRYCDPILTLIQDLNDADISDYIRVEVAWSPDLVDNLGCDGVFSD